MDLFNQFKDTIFLKNDNSLEKQLISLKKIRNSLEDTKEIDNDIKIMEYGLRGERQIEFELKNANIGMYVLHDVTYEYNGNKAQIDYLIFTKGYNYLIECKNLTGNITVDNTGQFYREYIYNGKKIKESIYSPYTQAVRHQDMLKKVWTSNHNKITQLIYGNMLNKNWFKPVVVLANFQGILNTRYAPKEIRENVIRADQLINYIKKDLENVNKIDLVSEGTAKKACEVWLERSVENNTDISKKYLKQIPNKDINYDLEKKLKEFRLKTSKKMNVPAYYIFTDNELNKLIETKPKTIDELNNLKILSDIKIKCHGEDIIRIINNFK